MFEWRIVDFLCAHFDERCVTKSPAKKIVEKKAQTNYDAKYLSDRKGQNLIFPAGISSKLHFVCTPLGHNFNYDRVQANKWQLIFANEKECG